MLKTLNKLTQRSFRLKHGAYKYIICVYEMAAILNMTTKEASGDVESSQFGFTTVKNIMKQYQNYSNLTCGSYAMKNVLFMEVFYENCSHFEFVG